MRKYLHRVSDSTLQKDLNKKITVGDFMEKYKEPSWCDYGPSVLEGIMGCWSLTDLFGLRHKISRGFCKKCECYIKPGTKQTKQQKE